MPLPTGSRYSRSRKAFVTDGFDCWKNAVQRFTNHENSEFHIAACESLFNVKRPSIVKKLSSAKEREMWNARIVLEKICLHDKV